MGSTAAPEVLLFKRFQTQWKFIDKTLFATIVTNKDFADIVIELSLIVMGATPPRGIHFLAPGAMHHARWMSKLIYSLKIWIFHEQVKLTDREKNRLLQMCIFAVKIYPKAWIEALLAAAAPSNDLKLFQSIQEYASFSNFKRPKAFQINSRICQH